MDEFLTLSDSSKEVIHPKVLETFNGFRQNIQSKMSLYGISFADLNAYLSDNKKLELQKIIDSISDSVKKCIGPLEDYPLESDIKANILGAELIFPELMIKRLIQKANEGKRESLKEEKKRKEQEEAARALQAEQERKEKEEEERWEAAYKAVNPPMEDAEKYLDEAEFKEFVECRDKAISVYRQKGKDFLKDDGTYDYRRFLRKIEWRKDIEELEKIAKLEAVDFNRRLCSEMAKRKSQLHPKQIDHASYFRKNINDCRYTGVDFGYLLPEKQELLYDKAIINIIESRYVKSIPDDVSPFLYGKLSISYFLLPSADYVLIEEIPCLNFTFNVFVVAENKIWLKPGQKSFDIYTFNFPWIDGEAGLVPLEKPKFLGYEYFIITPRAFNGYFIWQAMPMVLVEGLLKGELQSEGITITELSDKERCYEIAGFKDEVVIPQGFVDYLAKIGSIERLADLGILTRDTVKLISNLDLSGMTRDKVAEEEESLGFKDEEFISRMASLGFSNKAAMELCSKIPRNLTLDEALRYALSQG